VGQAIDYYFFYGPALNRSCRLPSAKRRSSAIPKWAYGYWQCRERFITASRKFSISRPEFRKRKIPVDALVPGLAVLGQIRLDAMKFDEQYYPQPKEMMDRLHSRTCTC